jgi:hypothetical protein
MTERPDIGIRGAGGAPLAMVEVKNIPKLTLGAAARIRDQLTAYARAVPTAKYFLVLSQEDGFIWEPDPNGAYGAEGERISMRPVLREYLSDAELDRHIRGSELELVLVHWFGDLARGRLVQPGNARADGPFARFAADIRDAQVELETAV